MWMWSTGINRNIVECKDSCKHISFHEPYRINRNIVECKEQLAECHVIRNASCINRNIVECKD